MHQAIEALGNDAPLMVDTASAYGDAEERLGTFFGRNGKILSRCFIATKWGEIYYASSEKTEVKHTIDNLYESLQQSAKHLPRIDALYMHVATPQSVSDNDLVERMVDLRESEEHGIKLIGFSTSKQETLEAAIASKTIKSFDIVQVNAGLVHNHPELIKQIYDSGRAVVVNSAKRSQQDKDPKKAYEEILQHPHVTMLLTGSRNHLLENVSYAKDLK